MSVQPNDKEPLQTLGLGALRPGTLQVTVRPGVQLESLQQALVRITDLHGCTSCGLNGLDLRFIIQDPMLNENFKDIEGIQDVRQY